MSQASNFFAELRCYHEWIDRQRMDGLEVERCIPWLRDAGLTIPGMSYVPRSVAVEQDVHLRVHVKKVSRVTQAELEAIQKRWVEQAKAESRPDPATHRKEILRELTNPKAAVALVDVKRMPADAFAFYHPFHLEPCNEWGIYIRTEKLRQYALQLVNQMSERIASFTLETLLSCLLFEVFNHEFFHHIAESAATAAEVLLASSGSPTPLYRDYVMNRLGPAPNVGLHPHTPLEEALANAYAYNSFSFISRVKARYKTVLVKLYQALLLRTWPKEPEGYRDAACYIDRHYRAGASELLAILLRSVHFDPAALRLVAANVFLQGHSALCHKPQIPTYFIGDSMDLALLNDCVPAPVETCTTLF